MGSGHPWELTVGDLVRKLRRDYGIESGAEPSEPGRPGMFLYCGTMILALPGIEEHDILSESTLRSICRSLHLPAVDFGLDPEDDD